LEKVLRACSSKSFDPLHIELSSKLLELNPEVYTVWNFRRHAFGTIVEAGGEGAVTTIAGELALTERALMKNPKSYSTWHHRRWAVGSGFCSLEKELLLVEKLLEADSRNFHGWGYRQFIARKMGLPVERELAFTQKKIEQNFSNYSAWHYRTALLPAMHFLPEKQGEEEEEEEEEELGGNLTPPAVIALAPEEKGEEGKEEQNEVAKQHEASSAVDQIKGVENQSLFIERGAPTSASASVPAEVLDKEFEFVKQAFYTEPEDQSGWFYHRWLLGCSLARYQKSISINTKQRDKTTARSTLEEESSSAAAARVALINTLTTQAEMCKELLEIEPDAKWPLLTYTRLRQLLIDLGAVDLESDAEEAYKKLEEMDPLRKGFYRDAAQGSAHVVALPMQQPQL
jgi:geranylgeranyl transferase type-2 subunit alpha